MFIGIVAHVAYEMHVHKVDHFLITYSIRFCKDKDICLRADVTSG
jgi:hypothetical protein